LPFLSFIWSGGVPFGGGSGSIVWIGGRCTPMSVSLLTSVGGDDNVHLHLRDEMGGAGCLSCSSSQSHPRRLCLLEHPIGRWRYQRRAPHVPYPARVDVPYTILRPYRTACLCIIFCEWYQLTGYDVLS
jgi:hypothetical protein